jgi:hypothetical protein
VDLRAGLYTETTGKILRLCRRSNPGRPVYSEDIILTELTQLPSPLGKNPGTHWIGGWVGLRADLDTGTTGGILSFCRRSNPGSPVSSQTLH